MWFDDLRRDLVYAIRTIRRAPGFASVAVLSLALGIGANTAIFSAVNAVLIRQLPYADPERVVMVWEDATAAGFPRNTPAPGNYTEWVRLNRAFTGMAATVGTSGNLTSDGPPEQLLGRNVTGNFFSVLGATPVLGRTFTEEEDRAGAPVVVVSYGLWQRRWGGDHAIVGKTVLLNNARVEVIGVMPRSFIFRNDTVDYWGPIHFSPETAVQRRSHYLNVVARLKPGLTPEAANTDMRRVSLLLQQAYPETNGGNVRITTVVVPLKEDLLGKARVELLVLMAAAAAVLLIACANLASLLLARSVTRRAEIAVRTALGATRGRLLRQLVIEAMVLSFAGGAAGLILASAGVSLIAQLAPAGFPAVPTSVLDTRLLAFTFIVSTAAGLIFSLVPAWQSSRVSLRDAQQQGGRSMAGHGRQTRDALVVAQLAAAVVLLVSAGLMLRTFANLRATELGFTPDHVLTMRTPLARTPQTLDPVSRLAFYDRVLTRVRALPGVEDAAYANLLPFESIGFTNSFRIEGITLDADDPADAMRRTGTASYLRTLGVQLTEGRLLGDQDVDGAMLAVVINETMARKYWPNGGAVGHRMQFLGPTAPWYTVVGVVKNVRERGYELQMKPAIYVTAAQWRGETTDKLIVRTAGDPTSLAAPIRRIVADINAQQPIAGVRTLESIVDANLGDRRQQMTLLLLFAGLAVVLASIGLYGVLSYSVAQRTREFGVRMALGATPGSVLSLVLRHGAILSGAGLAIGAGAAWAATRAMNSLLYGVTAGDPMTFAAVLVGLAIIGLVASVVPAGRATRVDPLAALRAE
jgi:putative ABC transport system permease protein